MRSGRSSVKKGAAYEYKIRDYYKAQKDTLYVIRSAGSRGSADLIVVKKRGIILVQVKRTKDPFKDATIETAKNIKIAKMCKFPAKVAVNREIVFKNKHC